MAAPIGGESNAMGVGGLAAMNAKEIVKAGVAQYGSQAALSQAARDSFTKGGLKAIANNTLPIADALQSQFFVTRWVQKLPVVGKYITNFLGPDAILNNAIGGMGKDGMIKGLLRKIPGISGLLAPAIDLGTATQATVTRIALEGGTDTAKKLIAAGVPASTATIVVEKVAERAAAVGANVVTNAAGSAVVASTTTAVESLAARVVTKEALEAGLKQTALKGVSTITQESVKQALQAGSKEAAIKALRDMGFKATFANKIAAEAFAGGAKTVATGATVVAAQQVAKSGGIWGSIKGAAGKLLSGAKGNFVVAGVFALATNTIALATGKMSLTQWAGLTVMDTAAYGAIGWGSAAAGAAIGSVVPVFGTAIGFIAGFAIGVAGGLIYEKFLRNPVKSMLPGPDPSGGATPDAYDPSKYGPAPVQDPYAANPANRPAAAPVMPNSAGGISYEEALRAIQQMPQ